MTIKATFIGNHSVMLVLWGAIWVLLTGCGTTVPPPNPNGRSAAWTLAPLVDQVVLTKMKAHRLPGVAIGVASSDSVLYAKGYGWANVAEERVVTENSLFHTASISKLFTAQAVMQLVRKGQLKTESRIVDLLPELHYLDNRFAVITVGQLLNHTSGLPDIRNYRWCRNHLNPESLSKYLRGKQWPLETAPGEQFRYSNLGYDLLGYLVEGTSEVPFEHYLKDSLLLLSRMHHSDFRYFLLPDSLTVTPYTKSRVFGGIRSRSVYPYTREHAPSSTLNASSRELAEWMKDFLAGLKKEDGNGFYRKMIQSSTDLADGIGLGFQRYVIDGESAVGHFGGDRGFRSFLVMFPELDLGIIVMGNCDFAEDFRQEIAREVLGVVRGRE